LFDQNHKGENPIMTQTATPNTSTWNKVVFTGNLGKDPETNYTPNGNAVTKFSLAVGQGKEKPPMWLNIECWKELAEQCNRKLAKGAHVEIEGRLAQDTWKDKTTKEQRYAFKVVAQTVRLLKLPEKKSTSSFIDTDADESDPLGDLSDHPF
jgi:single-strand DNA-binding protein